MAGRVAKGGETRSRTVRLEFGLGLHEPLADALAAVEDTIGVPVAILDGLEDGVAGAYLRRPGGAIIPLNGRDLPVRLRFTLAHELGHHCFHDARAIDTYEDLQTNDWREVRANAFAAGFLMPREAVDAWYEAEGRPAIDLAAVISLADHFGVSTTAALIRLQSCELLETGEWPDRLKQQIGDGFAHARSSPFEDSISRALDSLPRLPPGRSLFRATARGDLSPAAAAAQSGHSPQAVTIALDDLGLLPP